MSFGDRLRRAREKKGLSQQDLANILNVTDGTISNYEKEIAFPRWETMKKLCVTLSVDPNYLYWDNLSDEVRLKVVDQMTFAQNDEGIDLYRQLDEIDKAFVRGEMRQMLRDKKYQQEKPKHKPFSGPRPAQIAAYGHEVVSIDNKPDGEE